MQAKKTAPPEIANNTACPELVSGKQSLRPFSSIINTIIKYKDCTCALACPAGGPPRRMIFLVLFASKPVPIHREQKEHKRIFCLSKFYILSFACVKERTKEKHTGNHPDTYRNSHCRTP
jgi:hypothetical protein